MVKVRFLTESKNELKNILNYYSKIDPKLAQNFIIEVRLNIKLILDFPKLTPKDEKDNTQALTVDKFPYKIVFFNFNKTIWVVAIAHKKRFPKYWRKRLNRI